MSVGLTTSAQAAEPAWTATQIGEAGFAATAVNDQGAVAGYLISGGHTMAVVWRNGTTTALDTPENTIDSLGSAMNNLGQVVGYVRLQLEASVRQEAVLWDADGSYTLLGFLEGGYSSAALDINDLGQVVGWASRPTASYAAFLWEGDALEALPVPPAPPCPPSGCTPYPMTIGFAYGVNNEGEIVGFIGYSSHPAKAVLWEPSATPVFLPPLAEGTGAQAWDINEAGDIVGFGSSGGFPISIQHAIHWADGVPSDLGSLGRYANASGINDAGLIVGFLGDTEDVEHPYVWEDSVGTPLPLLAGDLEGSAAAVNEAGQIVGSSRSPTGVLRSVMWTRSSETTPPAIVVVDKGGGSDFYYNATSPAGALVEYTATVTDDTDPNPTLICEPPSGTVWPIGITTLGCMATDASGNTSNVGMDVWVLSAAEQLIFLNDRAAESGGPGTSLADKIGNAQAALDSGRRD